MEMTPDHGDGSRTLGMATTSERRQNKEMATTLMMASDHGNDYNTGEAKEHGDGYNTG